VKPVPTPAPTPAPTTTPTPTPVPALSRVFGIDSGNAVYDCSWFNAQRFLNTAGDGILTRLELLVNDTTPAGNVRLGVYADNNGIPGNLLLDAGEATAVNGWTGINNLNLQVKSSSYYWLAFLPQNALGVSYQTSGMEVNCHTCYGYPYGSLPATFGKGEFNSTPFVMRATVNILAPSQETESKTFGLDNGNSTWNQKAGILDVMRFTNTAGSGYLTKLELLFADSTPSGKVRFGVYADNYSKPGNRLLDAGETSVVNGWASISNLYLPVKANTSYWLAFDMQSGNTVRYQSGQAANSHYWVSYQYGTLPYSYPSAYRYVNNSPYVMRATVVSQ